MAKHQKQEKLSKKQKLLTLVKWQKLKQQFKDKQYA
jgi:hypothetical protein